MLKICLYFVFLLDVGSCVVFVVYFNYSYYLFEGNIWYVFRERLFGWFFFVLYFWFLY